MFQNVKDIIFYICRCMISKTAKASVVCLTVQSEDTTNNCIPGMSHHVLLLLPPILILTSDGPNISPVWFVPELANITKVRTRTPF